MGPQFTLCCSEAHFFQTFRDRGVSIFWRDETFLQRVDSGFAPHKDRISLLASQGITFSRWGARYTKVVYEGSFPLTFLSYRGDPSQNRFPVVEHFYLSEDGYTTLPEDKAPIKSTKVHVQDQIEAPHVGLQRGQLVETACQQFRSCATISREKTFEERSTRRSKTW